MFNALWKQMCQVGNFPFVINAKNNQMVLIKTERERCIIMKAKHMSRLLKRWGLKAEIIIQKQSH